MRVQLYFSFYLYFLLCISVHCYTSTLSEEEIYRKMHLQQKLCGPVIANTMRELCLEYNGIRAKRSITECCKEGCTFYYLMTYFCKVPRVKLDEIPSWMLSATSATEKPKVTNSGEQMNQNLKNTDFGQVRIKLGQKKRKGKHLGKRKKHFKCHCPRRCKESIPNKIHKQQSSEEVRYRPADYGYVPSTRPPIIYGHSNTISKGVINYHFPNQNHTRQ